jgi:hypothetical protein
MGIYEVRRPPDGASIHDENWQFMIYIFNHIAVTAIVKTAVTFDNYNHQMNVACA